MDDQRKRVKVIDPYSPFFGAEGVLVRRYLVGSTVLIDGRDVYLFNHSLQVMENGDNQPQGRSSWNEAVRKIEIQ